MIKKFKMLTFILIEDHNDTISFGVQLKISFKSSISRLKNKRNPNVYFNM